MKIGFVRRGYSSTGGAEAYLRRLADGVAREGHVPVLIGSPEWPAETWPGEFVVRIAGGSPREFAEGVERAAFGCDRLFSLERIARCDVFRAGDGVHRSWLARRAAFEPRWKGWARAFNRKHRELLALEEKVFSPECTGAIIANSGMVRDEILAFYHFPAERIHVIPNGYDAPEIPEDLRERRRGELGIGAGEYLALFVGSGWERKGLRVALDAVAQCGAMQLLVAGRGKMQGPVGGNVRFLGPRTNLQADFAAADVFVLPTYYDPFSNACLEALAAGLPVVTTTANGFAEILDEGVHGSACLPGDVAGIANALEQWRLGGTEVREACRSRAREYSVERNTRLTLDLLERVPALPRPHPSR